MNDESLVMDVTLADAAAYLRDPEYRVSVLAVDRETGWITVRISHAAKKPPFHDRHPFLPLWITLAALAIQVTSLMCASMRQPIPSALSPQSR